ncbi:energy transducer TonB [Chromobacterium sphagni]|uniref:TonB C-terminal domain-containing protein n=1 Tax=Chromobacterium sphagni TaxID=1903179 RepID=A0A1S1WYJ8_9NEIS|nr:energy transducer TonB [Chromobacterium sphagni]OHX12334.1 hypothetical protein BI347_01550 [Chromobacterium sphagni]OHX21582.1 hypothetical protein BI344_03460 [Chromobacterium sphagni]
MKPLPTLQFSAIAAVLGVHALALLLLSHPASRELPVAPPRLQTTMTMTMLAPSQPAPPKAAAPSVAKPQKPQVQAKAAPNKPAPKTPQLPVVKPQTNTPPPAPAKAINVATAAPAAPPPAPAPAKAETGGKPDGDSRQQPISEPLAYGGYLNNPQPAYPAISKEEGETGTVKLRVHVSAQGLPLEVSVQSSSGFTRLDRAALASVKRWRFIPAKRGAEPIAYTYIVPVEFSLKSAQTT